MRENLAAVGRHATLGTRQSKRGRGRLCFVRLALFASARIDLFRRVRFAGDTNQRVGLQSRNPAGARLLAGEAELGADPPSPDSDSRLVERRSWISSVR